MTATLTALPDGRIQIERWGPAGWHSLEVSRGADS